MRSEDRPLCLIGVGFVAGMMVASFLLGLTTFFVNKHIVAAALTGLFIGAGGCWAVAVYDRDLFRSHRELRDARKQVAYLTRALQAEDGVEYHRDEESSSEQG